MNNGLTGYSLSTVNNRGWKYGVMIRNAYLWRVLIRLMVKRMNIPEQRIKPED